MKEVEVELNEARAKLKQKEESLLTSLENESTLRQTLDSTKAGFRKREDIWLKKLSQQQKKLEKIGKENEVSKMQPPPPPPPPLPPPLPPFAGTRNGNGNGNNQPRDSTTNRSNAYASSYFQHQPPPPPPSYSFPNQQQFNQQRFNQQYTPFPPQQYNVNVNQHQTQYGQVSYPPPNHPFLC